MGSQNSESRSSLCLLDSALLSQEHANDHLLSLKQTY
jgi:hypothetical protein